MATHLAFKCNYCDGGEKEFVGFAKACTADTIMDNIDNHVERSWCREPGWACSNYYKSGFKGESPEGPCYDSRLFSTWSFGAGYNRRGKKAGTPKKITSVSKGSIAVFTTIFPGEKERDRKIIGLFRVGKVDDSDETVIIADTTHRLRLPLQVSKELHFWDYYKNKGNPGSLAWNSGLFRYLEDSQVARILQDIADVSQETDNGRMSHFCH